MSEIVILLIFLFFAVLGAGTLTARLWLLLVRPTKREKTFTVMRLKEEEKEENFIYIFEKYRWYGKSYSDYLIFLCDSSPGEKITSFINAHDNIICCKENQVAGIIKKLTEENDERKYSASRKA